MLGGPAMESAWAILTEKMLSKERCFCPLLEGDGNESGNQEVHSRCKRNCQFLLLLFMYVAYLKSAAENKCRRWLWGNTSSGRASDVIIPFVVLMHCLSKGT